MKLQLAKPLPQNIGNNPHPITHDRVKMKDPVVTHSGTDVDANESRISDTDRKILGALIVLGAYFWMSFESLGKLTDLDKAISYNDSAVQLAPDGHPEKPGLLKSLGVSSVTRFQRLGDIADIDKAILSHRNAVRLTLDSHPNKHAGLNYLGISLLIRFERLGDIEDIDAAISTLHDAVQLTPDRHPGKPNYLSHLGTALQRRCERLGNIKDIEESILAQRNAVGLITDNHPNKSATLTNLGNSLLTRFTLFGDVKDIHEAISCHGDAVRLDPDSHSHKHVALHNLGASFLGRFQHLGEVVDLDEAISALHSAVRLAPEGHRERPGCLNSLGLSLLARFERFGEIKDVEQAISAHHEAVRLNPDGHPNKPAWLNNLGSSFLRRFEHLGDIADLERAVLAQRKAVRLAPDGHPNKPHYLNNLGVSLQERFKRLDDVADAEGAISAQRDALRLFPDGHPNKPGSLTNLGNSLRERFNHLETITDLDEAILAQQKAVQLTPDGHPNKLACLCNLGHSLQTRFDHLGDVADIDKAMFQFFSAACSSIGPALHRFRPALRWARCALREGRSSHLDAYRHVLDLLPRVAWLGLPMAEQHRELVDNGRVVREAAAAAIASGQYDTALEWLEQGRSIVWGQILHLRTPVDDLRASAPALADRLVQVSEQLEHPSSQDPEIQPSRQLSLGQSGSHHRQMALEWDRLVESARAVPGFEDFLRPKKLSQLTRAARSGPVVIFTAYKGQCDALILKSEGENVIHVPLNDLSVGRVQALRKDLEGLLANAGVRSRAERHLTSAKFQRDDDSFEGLLAELWKYIVKPVLDRLGFPVSRTSEPPRLWWCPTGPFTFLPLHAAGLYHTNRPGFKITDFVTSSYTLTLTALLNTSSTALRPFQLLAITQPSTPGQSSLPNTERELRYIREHAGSHPFMSLEGVEATVERVVQGMKDSNWVHLACHGGQSPANPTKSALFLQDGRLELSDIIKMSLPCADFAFLSACQTATGDDRLAEEAVHLAAGMLLAGYRSVIATTWSIKDNDAPLVADEVYAHLFKDGQPDRTRAAHALHHAMQRLREQGASFLSWVPFIHLGL